LKEIYIDGELEMVDTTNWFPKVLRKDFTVGMVVSENGLDDPDQNFYENYACGAAPLPSTDGTLQLRDRWFAGLSAGGGSQLRTRLWSRLIVGGQMPRGSPGLYQETWDQPHTPTNECASSARTGINSIA